MNDRWSSSQNAILVSSQNRKPLVRHVYAQGPINLSGTYNLPVIDADCCKSQRVYLSDEAECKIDPVL